MVDFLVLCRFQSFHPYFWDVPRTSGVEVGASSLCCLIWESNYITQASPKLPPYLTSSVAGTMDPYAWFVLRFLKRKMRSKIFFICLICLPFSLSLRVTLIMANWFFIKDTRRGTLTFKEWLWTGMGWHQEKRSPSQHLGAATWLPFTFIPEPAMHSWGLLYPSAYPKLAVPLYFLFIFL